MQRSAVTRPILRRSLSSSSAPEVVAEYKNAPMKRGTRGLYETPHLKEVIANYSSRQLRTNFWGTKEWFYLSRERAAREHPQASFRNARTIANELQKHHMPSEVAFPLDAEALTDVSQEERQDVMDEMSRTTAILFPSSPFAIEERVKEAWSHFTTGTAPESILPHFVNVGGVRVDLQNPYQAVLESAGSLEGCSPKAIEGLRKLEKACSPFGEAELSPDLLGDVVTNCISTVQDIEQLLPAFLYRWRLLNAGHVREGFETPSPELTAAILELCISNGCLDTALDLLRHKMAYKLDPTQQSLAHLMKALALRHLQMCSNPEQLATPDQPGEPPAPEPSPYAGKRSLPKHAYPFRMVPRLYYYKPLPAVLDPEPSAFAEYQLPALSAENHNKRLMPDDRRKKIKMLIDDAELNAKQEATYRPRESNALGSLTQMYQLFHNSISRNPRYYGYDATTALFDPLIVAGAVGGIEEGLERSCMAAGDASKAGQLSKGSLATLRMYKQDGDFSKLNASQNDTLGLDYLDAVLGRNVDVLSTERPTANMDELDGSFNKALNEKLAPLVAQVLIKWREEDADRAVTAVRILSKLPQTRSLLDQPSFAPLK